MTKLEKLLFGKATNEITQEEAEKIFYKAALELMLKYVLIIGKAKYYFAEIEFYLFSDLHPDSSTHCHPFQKNTSHWYFHRHGETENLRTHKRKGVDIVIGNGKCCGGILIRAIQNVASESGYIYGPSEIVDEISKLSENDFSSIAKGIEDEEISINQLLSIEKYDQSKQEVLACPRHGLGKTPSDFIDKPYRFITFPYKEHRGKEKIIIPYLKKNYSDEKLLELFKRKTLPK